MNSLNLMKLAFLAIVMLFIYGVIGYIWFSGDYNTDLNYSSTFLITVFTTIKDGLKYGEGIGANDILKEPMYYPDQRNSYYWGRYIFDTSFYLFINLLFLNLIFGIILDKFSELRTKR